MVQTLFPNVITMTETDRSVASYLHKHFVTKVTFAQLAQISAQRLGELIAIGAIPEPSSVCDSVSMRSAVFGAISLSESVSGAYFRPECIRWVRLADAALAGSERAAVIAALTDELRVALKDYLSDEQQIESRIAGYLPYFFNGTFGLCVADPSTGAGIVRKEMLQEQLIALTANGTVSTPTEVSKSELLHIIDAYAESAMPFSPAERDRSSRKRLVDDMRLALTEN